MEILLSLLITLLVLYAIVQIIIFILKAVFYLVTLPFHATWALEKEIIMLLNGDRKTATRLIKSQRRANRDRSYRWCLEKVIRDLERDRRR